MQRFLAASFTSLVADSFLAFSFYAVAANHDGGGTEALAGSCDAPPYETPTWTEPPDDGVALGSLLEASGYGSPTNSSWVDLAAGNFCGGPEKELAVLKNRHSYFSILRGPAPYAVGTGDLDSSSLHPWRAIAAGNLDGGTYDHIVAVRKVSASGVPDLVVLKAAEGSCEVQATTSRLLGNPSNSEWVDAAIGNFDGKGNVIALLKAVHSNFFLVRLNSPNNLEIVYTGDLDSSSEHPWRALAAGDIDGDGIDELIAARRVSDRLSATILVYKWQGSGFELFTASTFGNNGNSDWTSATVGDFNADGRKAIVVVKPAHSNFVVLDLPRRARELRVLATADLDSDGGQNWRGLAAIDWLGNDQGASELVAVRAATGRYRTDLFVYGNPFHRVSRDTGLAGTRAQWQQERSVDTNTLKQWLSETHTNSLSWRLQYVGDYPRLTEFLHETRKFCVDGQQLRVSVTLEPRPGANSCSVPEESGHTAWSEALFFPGGLGTQSCGDFLGWSSLIGRLAQDYPHLVAVGIDDFSHYMDDPPFTMEHMAQFVSRMRAQAPWLNFVPTAYYKDFYIRVSISPPVYSVKRPDITRTFDTMLFYFRNEKAGECLSGSCGERSVRNAPGELIDMSKLLAAGRKLHLGMYFGTHSALGHGTTRYAYDLVNLGLNLPWIGGTTAYPMQTRRFMCDELNFLDDVPTDPLYDKKFCVLWKAYGRKPQYVTYQDLTDASGARRAARDPIGYAFPAIGAQSIVYGANNGHVHEILRTATDIEPRDLTDGTGAPLLSGDPKAYVFAPVGVQNVLYRGTDAHLHRLFWSTGPVTHEDLTELSDAAGIAGNPSGYAIDGIGTQHAVYRGADGHLHALSFGGGTVEHRNLTTSSSAPMAVGNLFAYAFLGANEHNVVYRGTNGHLHRLFWSTGTVGHRDLTAESQAPNSADDPMAYVASAASPHNVVYRGTDGRLHRLSWSTGSVDHVDLYKALHTLSPAIRAPSPVGTPTAYFVGADGTHHVVFRGTDNHLHELSWTVGVVTHNDLSALGTAPSGPVVPSAVGNPSAYFSEADGTHHVIYRTINGHVHELRWSR